MRDGYCLIVPHGADAPPPDPGIRAVLEELRDLRLEMRAERRQGEVERRQAEVDRRKAEADRRQAEVDRRQADERYGHLIRRSDERFQHLMREFRQDAARRDAMTRKMFKDVHTVGLSIVKTLNRHTRLLERIDRKLGVRENGRGASHA